MNRKYSSEQNRTKSTYYLELDIRVLCSTTVGGYVRKETQVNEQNKYKDDPPI